MKKLLLSILFLLSAVPAMAQVFAAPSDMITYWQTVNTNTHARWDDYDDSVKYAATSTGSYADNIYTNYSTWCGRKPYGVTLDSSTDTFTISAQDESYQDTFADDYTTNDDQIHLRATACPTGATCSDAQIYYVINKSGSTFQISTSQGGAAVDMSDNGTAVTFYPADKVFHRPDSCTTYETSNDEIRNNLYPLYWQYGRVKAGLTASEKLVMEDIMLHYMEVLAGGMSDEPPLSNTDLRDSDRVTTNLFLTLMGVAQLSTDYPTETAYYLSHAGGWDGSAAAEGTWREAFYEWHANQIEGCWVESSQYNLNVKNWLKSVIYINDFLGEDKFPEVTANYEAMAQCQMEEFLPQADCERGGQFGWGDTQDNTARCVYRVAQLHVAAYAAREVPNTDLSERLLYMADALEADYAFTITTDEFMNPYATRKSQVNFEGFGPTFYNDSRRGLAYYHTGWNPASDSTFFNVMWESASADHGLNFNNFGLDRAGYKIVDYTRLYASKHDEPVYNHFNIWGGYPRPPDSGQSAIYQETDLVYVVGSWKGRIAPDEYKAPWEHIYENTREILYRRNDDGSDTVVTFDRIDTSTIPSTSDFGTTSYTKINTYFSTTTNKLESENQQHYYNLHVPGVPDSVSTDTWNFTVNTEPVIVKTFFDDYGWQILFPMGQIQANGNKIAGEEIATAATTDPAGALDANSYYNYRYAIKVDTKCADAVEYRYSGNTFSGAPELTGGTTPAVAVSNIPLGPSGCTTERYLYRTVGHATSGEASADTSFYLAATIANNVDTTYTDTMSDATLVGDAAPTWATVSADYSMSWPDYDRYDGSNQNNTEWDDRYYLRILPTQNEGFLSGATIIHAGSSPTFTELLKSDTFAGNPVKGVFVNMASDDFAIVFNAERGWTRTADDHDCCNSTGLYCGEVPCAIYGQTEAVNQKRRMRAETYFEIPTTGALTLYVGGLVESTHSWDITVDGATTSGITVQDGGFYKHSIGATGASSCTDSRFSGSDCHKITLTPTRL